MARKTHPRARRKRGVEDEPDDRFLAWIMQAVSWAQERSQLLILGIVSLAVVIAASVYWVTYRRGLAERATMELESIQQTVGMGQNDAAEEQLAQFLERFGGTHQALEARLLLAELHLKDGDAEEALSVAQAATSSLDQPLTIQVAFLQAEALEELSRWKDAEDTYLRIANASDMAFQINEALASAARIRAMQGNFQGAADLYKELLAGLDKDDSSRGLFEMRLAEVQAHLEGGG